MAENNTSPNAAAAATNSGVELDTVYKYGFVTDIETDTVPRGLNEDTIRLISQKKNEPEWMLEYRLKAYRHWLTMEEPEWANVQYPKINFQDIVYYSAPKKVAEKKSLDELDPELLDVCRLHAPSVLGEDPLEDLVGVLRERDLRRSETTRLA